MDPLYVACSLQSFPLSSLLNDEMIVFMRVCVFVFGLMRTQLLLLLYDVFIACAHTRPNTQLNRPCSLTMKRWMYQCNGIAC